MGSLGDFAAGSTIDFKFTTADASGSPITLAGSPVVSIYKDNSVTQSTAGVTLTVDFDAVPGLHHVRITTASDGSFYADDSSFCAVLTAGTVGGTNVAGNVLESFTLAKTAAIRPTTAGRTLDVSAGGEAGVDWANVGSPTTTVGLSGTTVKTATDVETDTQDLQARTPAALVGGKMDSDATAISGDTTAADNLEKEYDGTGYGHILQRTTIATLASQTSFTLTAGSADNDAYNGCIAVIEDASTAAQKAVAVIGDYTGATKTVTLLNDPAVFTMATTDIVTIIADRALKATVDNRTLDVSAAGESGIDWANIGSPTTAQNLSATNIDVDQIVASVSGAVGSVTGAVGSVTGAVGSVAAGGITAASIATDAIDADALAADAGTELGTAVWATSTRALTDKAGFSLSSAGVQAIWDALTSALTTAGSVGKLLVDNINATISSRLATSGYTAPPTAAQNATELLDQAAGVETNRTVRQAFRLILSAVAGKLSGGQTATNTFRDTNDTVNRIVATVTADGDRTAVTLDAS